MKNLFDQLEKTLLIGKAAVLVSIIASSGSTPRGAGAHMLITDEGRIAGTIGGGAVEYRSQQMAAEVLQSADSKIHSFLLKRNEVEDLGMICGGDVEVYFQYIPAADAAALDFIAGFKQAVSEHTESWLIMNLSEKGELTLYNEKSGFRGASLPENVKGELELKKSGKVHLQGRDFYIENIIQSGYVYIFGGGHVAQALVPVLAALDFKTVVVEDREDFTNPDLFLNVEKTILLKEKNFLPYIPITENDYICIMTRGHKDDLEFEYQALQTKAYYIGVMGSARKIAAVNAELLERGIAKKDLLRINTPIGKPIKAETPAEIAISIAAELIEKRAEKI